MSATDQTPPAGSLPESIEPGTPLYDVVLDVYMAAFTSGAASALATLGYDPAQGKDINPAQQAALNSVAVKMAQRLFDRLGQDPIARKPVQGAINIALARAQDGTPNPFATGRGPKLSTHIEFLPRTSDGGDPCQL